MATKLYPPHISGTLPAFYMSYDAFNDRITGATITIPFTMNEGVNSNLVNGFVLRVKTTQTSSYLFDPITCTSYNLSDGTAVFKLEEDYASAFNEGQFYKVLLAYLSTSDEVGYYSTVGIIKCVSKPSVYIEGMSNDSINAFSNAYLGIYSLTDCEDKSEKEYSYQFDFYSEDDTLLYSSGELIHDTSNDTDYSYSTDRYVINDFFDDDKTYKVKYTITTMNGLTISSSSYSITTTSIALAPETISFYVYGDYYDGYMKLTMKGDEEFYTTIETDEDGNTIINPEGGTREKRYYGQFLISRSSELDNYNNWIELYRFRLENDYPSSVEFHDFTVQLGIKYKYALQEYNINDLYTDRKYAVDEDDNEIVSIDFEDMYLFDGKRQLKIKFNPQMSSFKTDILETKTDTIGSKYPFIFRNGKVAYKEFPLGGLISFLQDDNKLFYGWDDITLIRTFSQNDEISPINKDSYKSIDPATFKTVFDSERYNKDTADKIAALNKIYDDRDSQVKDYTDTDLVERNVLKERIFKLEVLDWLNNGKPKLFRSPTEGNYIVRVLNTSLSPETSIGRMLHSFSSTAYEIAEFNYDNLVKYGFVTLEEPSDYVPLWRTIILDDDEQNKKDKLTDDQNNIIINFDSDVTTFIVLDMYPGSIIKVKYGDTTDYEEIHIGVTGSYTLVGNTRTIKQIYIPYICYDNDGSLIYIRPTGSISINYKGLRLSDFDAVTDVKLKTIIAKLFIGVDPDVKNMKSTITSPASTGYAQYAFELDLSKYNALKNLKIRDYLDRVIINKTVEANVPTYHFKETEDYEEFKQQVINLEPGDTIQEINSTIYDEEKYKVQLINMEHVNLRLRELMPIYVDPKDDTKFSMTPFGLPYPIDELFNGFGTLKYTFTDPTCIFEAFKYNATKGWEHYSEVSDSDYYYYDPYWGKWTDEYNTSFYINDKYVYHRLESSDIVDNKYINDGAMTEFNANNLYIKKYDEYILAVEELPSDIDITDAEACFNALASIAGVTARIGYDEDNEQIAYYPFYIRSINSIDLSVIKEKSYDNLGAVSSLVIGNGVMAEETFLLKITDYYTEDSIDAVKTAKLLYIEKAALLKNLLLKYESIAIADENYHKYLVLKKAYYALINGSSTNKNYALDEDKDEDDLLSELLEDDDTIASLDLMETPVYDDIPLELKELIDFSDGETIEGLSKKITATVAIEAGLNDIINDTYSEIDEVNLKYEDKLSAMQSAIDVYNNKLNHRIALDILISDKNGNNKPMVEHVIETSLASATEEARTAYLNSIGVSSDEISDDDKTLLATIPNTYDIIINYYTELAGLLSDTINKNSELLNRYYEAYRNKYNTCKSLISSANTYTIIVDDKTGDAEFDSYVNSLAYDLISEICVYIGELITLSGYIDSLYNSLNSTDETNYMDNHDSSYALSTLINSIKDNENYKNIMLDHSADTANALPRYTSVLNKADAYLRKTDNTYIDKTIFAAYSYDTKLAFLLLSDKLLYMNLAFNKLEWSVPENTVDTYKTINVDEMSSTTPTVVEELCYRNYILENGFTEEELETVQTARENNNLYIEEYTDVGSVVDTAEYKSYFETAYPELEALTDETAIHQKNRLLIIQELVTLAKTLQFNKLEPTTISENDTALNQYSDYKDGDIILAAYGDSKMNAMIKDFDDFIYNLKKDLCSTTDGTAMTYSDLVRDYKEDYDIDEDTVIAFLHPILDFGSPTVSDDTAIKTYILESDTSTLYYGIASGKEDLVSLTTTKNWLNDYQNNNTTKDNHYTLSQIITDFIYRTETDDSGTEVESGIKYWYIQYCLMAKITDYQKALTQNATLKEEYTARNENYNEKYNNYESLYEKNYSDFLNYQSQYPDEFEFYNYSSADRATALAELEQEVKLDWNDFVIALDVAYTEEKERGQYK